MNCKLRTLLLTALVLWVAMPLSAEETTVASPDGKIVVTLACEKGLATYSVSYSGQQMLLPSCLGLKTGIGDFTTGLTVKNVRHGQVSRHYSMQGTKASEADYEANSLVVEYTNGSGGQMSVLFQVSNRDVAFRYELPRQKVEGKDMKRTVVLAEATSFRLPDGTTTFLSPQIGPGTGWEQTKPSYEEEYGADRPMATPSQYGQGYVFPALFHVGGTATMSQYTEQIKQTGKAGQTKQAGKGQQAGQGQPEGWVLISETGVTSGYCGSHLSDYREATGYTIAYPNAGENNGLGTPFAGIPLPGTTPWRTVTVGATLHPIVETTVSYDVVEPLYQPATDYRPGRYTWSWLIWQDKSINYDDQVKFIDLASTMGFEYCLVDNWWDTQIGRERVAELSRYAQSKGVHLLLWYNSNGSWNDAPQGPRNCMNTSIAREREMQWLQSIGVKGIKVDFFGGDKQETMRLYEDILSDANRYGLQVVFHGCTLPRGWERMYPNFVASEAVLASENVFFNDHAASREPFELTLHPYCRNATASMDWGGIIMNKYMSPDNKSRHHRMTTDIFELASGIILQTPVQCVAIQPNNLQELPQFELDFLRQLPTTWQQTRYIAGYPGRSVVLARQSTDGKWYVAGLNGTLEQQTLTLSLPMFAGQTVSLYVDKPQKVKGKQGALPSPSTPTLQPLKVGRQGEVKVTLQPNGGFIVCSQPSPLP